MAKLIPTTLRNGNPRVDALAGLTVWAILVPEALAYGSIAGVSPVVGLYAAPAAIVLYAILGSSRVLVVGPMAATAALSGASVADVATPGGADAAALTAGLAITIGLCALAAGLLRLGFLANFISEPVLKGFIFGLALTIIAGQAPKIFGVEGHGGDFFEKTFALLRNLGETSGPTLAVGAASLAVVLGLRRVSPKAPGALIAVIGAIVVTKAAGLDEHGVAIVGPIQSGLPRFGVPDVSITEGGKLMAASFGILLVALAEGLGAAKTYAGPGEEIDADRELVGLGGSNIAAGLSGGMVVGGSLSKTAVNADSGGSSQVSSLVAAGMVLLTLAFLTGLFEDLPEATLAAVVIAAVINLVDFRAMRILYRAYSQRIGQLYGFTARSDFIAAVAAALGVMVFDTLPGLFIGIGISLTLLIYRSSLPNVARLGLMPGTKSRWEDVSRVPEAVEVPGVVVLRPEAGLFFANSDLVRRRVRRSIRDDTTGVVIDAETVPFVDVTAVRMLLDLADDLHARGIALVVARSVGQVRDLVGPNITPRDVRIRFSPSVHEAVATARKGVTPEDTGAAAAGGATKG